VHIDKDLVAAAATALVLAALAVDVVMLTAMLTRIAQFGSSPKKVSALGLNLLPLVHLAGTARLTACFVRGRGSFVTVERWQARVRLRPDLARARPGQTWSPW
jgi:hypothetical protein